MRCILLDSSHFQPVQPNGPHPFCLGRLTQAILLPPAEDSVLACPQPCLLFFLWGEGGSYACLVSEHVLLLINGWQCWLYTGQLQTKCPNHGPCWTSCCCVRFLRVQMIFAFGKLWIMKATFAPGKSSHDALPVAWTEVKNTEKQRQFNVWQGQPTAIPFKEFTRPAS